MEVDESPISFEYLRKFNFFMGALHLVQAFIMVGLGFFNDFSRDVYTFYLKFEVENGNATSIEPNPEVFFTVDWVGPLVASFLFLSAIAHFSVAGPFYDSYVQNLQKKMNPYRWVEYAFSSSIMIAFIALLFGVWDFWALFLIFMMNTMMILFGWLMELHNQTTEKTDWTAFIFGSVAGIVPWVVITAYFLNIQVTGGEVPDFVYAIYFVEFVLFNCFAINMVLQYKHIGPWKDYLYGERFYIILSLVAKTALAWLVFAGTFQPD
ncbi:MAG: heliorhodopsin HeR [Candidatus Hodarchaeota archaeon]